MLRKRVERYRTYRSVAHVDVVHVHIFYNVDLSLVLAQTPHTNAMTPIAVQILHQDIRAVRLEAYAIVAVVDMAVLYHNVRRPQRIPPIGITGLDAGVGAVRIDGQIVVCDITAVRDDVEPIGRVDEVDVSHTTTFQADDREQDWSHDGRIDLKKFPPDLPLSVNSPAAVDIDVFAANLEEGGLILEGVLEAVGLPVVGVCREFDRALNIFYLI